MKFEFKLLIRFDFLVKCFFKILCIKVFKTNVLNSSFLIGCKLCIFIFLSFFIRFNLILTLAWWKDILVIQCVV